MSEARTSKPILLNLLRYSETFQGLFMVTLRTSLCLALYRRVSLSAETTSGSSASCFSRASVGATANRYGLNPRTRIVMDSLSRVLPYSSMTGRSSSMT